MSQTLFQKIKEVLDKQDFIKITCDENEQTFTCDQFDTPIVLVISKVKIFFPVENKIDNIIENVKNKYEYHHIHHILHNFEKGDYVMTSTIDFILDNAYNNIFAFYGTTFFYDKKYNSSPSNKLNWRIN